MKKTTIAIAVAAIGAMAFANTVKIWPEGKMPLAKKMPPERMLPITDDVVRITDVSEPSLTFSLPPESSKPMPAVIVCPGGGYSILAWNHEGTAIAQWLRGQGIAGVILKYRCPDQPDAAFCDAQRAVSFLRANAAKYNIDPNKIGIMGFSAGANLTCRTAANHAKRAYESIDEIDKVSCRPDFQLPIYPWQIVPGRCSEERLPLEIDRKRYPVDSTTPPAFIVQTEDDFVHVENALAYYAALKFAGVKAEMHLYPDGQHGYGIRHNGASVDGWELLAEAWLRRITK